MFGYIVSIFLGIFAFLFIFWKKLKEDYISDQIFSAAFLIIFGLSFGALLSFYFLPIWWFWLSIVGIAVGFSISIVRLNLRFFEVLEALIVGLMPLLVFIFLTDAAQNSILSSLVYSLGIVALIGLYYFFNMHYKNFSWYKSGRVGFAGLTTGGLFFLLRAGIAIFSPNVLSFVGKFETVLSCVAAFGLFLLVFNLARSEI